MRFASTTVAALALVLTMGGCQGSFGEDSEHRDGHPEDGTPMEVPTPACPIDPDCHIGGDCTIYECPEYWICEDLATGIKRCTNPGPDYPDGGDWECEDVNGQTVCRGSSYPDGGGDGSWACETQAEFVVCTSDTPSYPDEGSDGPWNCWFSGEFRICESGTPDGGGWTCFDTPTGRQCRQRTPDYPDDRGWDCYDTAAGTVCESTGDFPDGGGGGEWNCERRAEFVVCTSDSPDFPDDGGDGPWDCRYEDEFRVCDRDTPDVPDDGGSICVPGVQRWCDDAIYCSWGKQTCRPDGSWGRCIEPTVTSSGLTDRPATECGCRYFYFNEDCCEDQGDRDGDGHPDCIIPSDHTAPACPSDGGLCSFCDSHTDCGGTNDLCLFARDGYALCGSDCSSTGCPSGYGCEAITTRAGTVRQCVPSGGRCE